MRNQQQNIAAINAQFATAVSIVENLAQEVQDEWDNVPTVITRTIAMSELMQELREVVRGERQTIDAPAIYANY